MGVPIAALGALAAAGGTAAQVYGNRQVANAQNRAVQAELDRQQSYRQQGKKAFETSLAQSSEPVAREQVQAGADQRLATMDKVAGVPLVASQANPVETQGVNVVTPSLQRSATAAANLQGYSEWELRQWIKNLRSQQNLRILNQFAQGSANVLPYELQDASHSQDRLISIGQIMQALGGVAGAASGGGSAASITMQSPGLDQVPSESQISTANAPMSRKPVVGYGYQ